LLHRVLLEISRHLLARLRIKILTPDFSIGWKREDLKDVLITMVSSREIKRLRRKNSWIHLLPNDLIRSYFADCFLGNMKLE
jgi:hypothetical protein